MSGELVLGVDGGGSKTRALIATLDGRVVGAGVAGSCNHHRVGVAGAVAAVLEAIANAGLAAGLGASPALRAACFGLAGIDREVDRRTLSEALIGREIAPRFEVINDVALVLAAGSAERWGVALNAGTGSLAFARSPDGRTARSGGWGHLCGDEGSGYSIAVAALHLATQTADGRADADRVLEEVLAHWGVAEPDGLLDVLYRPDLAIAEVSSLTTRILRLAEDGDGPALELAGQAAAHLAALVDTVVATLGLERPPVAMSGGVLRHPFMRAAVVKQVVAALGPDRLVDDPALGALAIARDLAAEPAAAIARPG